MTGTDQPVVSFPLLSKATESFSSFRWAFSTFSTFSTFRPPGADRPAPAGALRIEFGKPSPKLFQRGFQTSFKEVSKRFQQWLAKQSMHNKIHSNNHCFTNGLPHTNCKTINAKLQMIQPGH
jgi:hypothetical protein